MSERPLEAPENNLIQGVVFKELKTFPDDRGFFREVVRSSDEFFDEGGFAQWSHSKMTRDVVKAWHYHHLQIDWWYLGLGQIQTVLIDNRVESLTYRKKLIFNMGESDKYGPETFEACVRIPQGVLHGCRVLSDEAHLFYITSQTYNPDDEGRFPYNSSEIDHDWGEGAIVNDNDRRTFVPTAERVRLSS